MAIQYLGLFYLQPRLLEDRPIPNGKINTYSSLNPTIRKETYQDKDGTVPHQNPILLDAAGRLAPTANSTGEVYFKIDDADPTDRYYIEITDANDNIVYQWNNYPSFLIWSGGSSGDIPPLSPEYTYSPGGFQLTQLDIPGMYLTYVKPSPTAPMTLAWYRPVGQIMTQYHDNIGPGQLSLRANDIIELSKIDYADLYIQVGDALEDSGIPESFFVAATGGRFLRGIDSQTPPAAINTYNMYGDVNADLRKRSSQESTPIGNIIGSYQNAQIPGHMHPIQDMPDLTGKSIPTIQYGSRPGSAFPFPFHGYSIQSPTGTLTLQLGDGTDNSIRTLTSSAFAPDSANQLAGSTALILARYSRFQYLDRVTPTTANDFIDSCGYVDSAEIEIGVEFTTQENQIRQTLYEDPRKAESTATQRPTIVGVSEGSTSGVPYANTIEDGANYDNNPSNIAVFYSIQT